MAQSGAPHARSSDRIALVVELSGPNQPSPLNNQTKLSGLQLKLDVMFITLHSCSRQVELGREVKPEYGPARFAHH